MNFITVFLGLVGLLANLCLATDGAAAASYSNGLSTSILVPQEIGTMTVGGNLVYNMNVCSVVQQTICETSPSTGPAVAVSTPSAMATSAYNTPGGGPGVSATTPGAGSIPGQPASSSETGTGMSDAYTSTAAAATGSESLVPTGTYASEPSGTLTGSTPSVTTGAGSAVGVPALAWGFAGVVAGFLV